MNVFQNTALALTAAGFATQASAIVVFDLGETDAAELSHTSADATAAPPLAGSLDLGNGTFAWADLATDGSANTATFASGAFTSADWGGLGTFTSNTIDVSEFTFADISGSYSGFFNTPTEFSNFFYVLDGGDAVTFGAGLEDAVADNVAVGVSNLDLTGVSTLTVGFTYNHNGGSDSFSVGSLTVDAIPEPASLALVALGGVALLGRRRSA